MPHPLPHPRSAAPCDKPCIWQALVPEQEDEGGADIVTRLKTLNAELQRLAAVARPTPPGPPGERPMTFEEKRRLSMQIGEAHPKVLGEVMLVCSQDPSVAQVRVQRM